MKVRKLLVLAYCLLLMSAPLIAHAQTTPQQVNDALADLSAKLGKPIALNNLGSWTWEQAFYPDTSLGCPLAGQTYAQVQTSGYHILLTYQGTTYDYRVSADRKILFLCSPNLGSNAPATLVPTASAPQNVVVGQVVCPGSMAARLWVGGQGTSIATGSVNIRQQPTQTSQVAGLLLPNGQFNVTGGPRCDGIKTWWQISYTGSSRQTVNGWVMEGDAATNDYWLQPLGTPPTGTGNPMSPGSNSINASTAAQVVGLKTGPLTETPLAAAVVHDSANDITVLATPSRAISYYSNTQGVSPTVFSNTGRNYYGLVIGSNPGPVPLLRMATIETVAPDYTSNILRLWDIGVGSATPSAVEKFAFQLPLKSLNAMAFSPDGTLLGVSSGTANGNEMAAVWIWESATGTQRAPLMHTAAVGSFAFSPDNKTLVTACADGSVHIWDLATQTDLRVLPSTGDTMPPQVALSPDGTRLAVGRLTGAVELYAFPTGTPQTIVQATSQYTPVRFLVFSPDSTVLAVGGAGAGDAPTAERSISLWNAATGAAIVKIPQSEALLALDFSADGVYLTGIGTANWWSWGVQ